MGRHLREGAEWQAAGHHVPQRDPPGADLIPLTGQRCAPDAAGVAPTDSRLQVTVARDKVISDTDGNSREDSRRATGPVSHRQQFCPHSHTRARRLRGWQFVICARSLPALDRAVWQVGVCWLRPEAMTGGLWFRVRPGSTQIRQRAEGWELVAITAGF